MNPDVDALEQFFAAINRNDMQAMIRDFDPQIVRIEPEGFPTAGTYRGIADVQAHVRVGRGRWAEGSCEPEQFLVNGEKVVVYLHARVRLKDAADWTGGRFADGFVFRNGAVAADEATPRDGAAPRELRSRVAARVDAYVAPAAERGRMSMRARP